MNVGTDPEPIYGISLFSGVDGLGRGVALALPGLRTVCHVEREAYPVEVLAAEMEAGTMDEAPVWTDVSTFRAGEFARRVLQSTGRRVEVVYGGFPCQDISTAGKGAGITGKRSGLWSEFARVIREVGPRYVFVENVAALVGRGLSVVLQAFTELGYRYAWGTLEAADVGATHHRKRLFLVAVADGECVGGPGWRGSDHLASASRDPEVDGQQREWSRGAADGQVSRGGEESLVDDQGVGRSEGRAESVVRSGWHPAAGPVGGGLEGALGHGLGQGLEVGRVFGRDLGSQQQAAERASGEAGAAALEDGPRGRECGPLGEAGIGRGVRPSGDSLDGGLPLYPPGPDEIDEWLHIIEHWPWLAPAIVGSTPTQPSLHRMAHGAADRIDLCVCPRADRLKALGNGVVPIQAAVAYAQLLRRLGH